MYEDFKTSFDNPTGNEPHPNQNGAPASPGAYPAQPPEPTAGYHPNFTVSAPPPGQSPVPPQGAAQPPVPPPPPYNSVPGWGAAPPPKKPKARKPKKNHGVLKVACVAVAVIVFAFGFGYWGSQVAIDHNQDNFLKSASSEAQQPVAGEPSDVPAGDSDSSHSSNTGLWTGNTQEDYNIVEQVAAIAAPSVVEITTEGVQTDNLLRQRIVAGAGSGVIISEDGLIVTNNHVIQGANKITVTLRDGTQYPGKLVGADAKSDLAVVKIEATGLKPAKFGSSADLKVGELAVVIGNPLGQLGGTVTNGIISALDRQITVEDGQTMTLLQTNAAINPGNSGGGLFNAKGELVGIVNAKSGGIENGTTIEGLGFAIPIDGAKSVISDLAKYGYVRGRVDIGMTFLEVDDPITAMMYRVNNTGVYVMSVTPGSSADKTGIQKGDQVLSIDGQQISTTQDIQKILDSHSVGDNLKITVSRNGRTGDGTVTLGESKGETTPITNGQ